MSEKKTILTKQGMSILEEELKYLKEVRRKEIAEKIKEARAQGDLSENAEYDAAKEEQGEIETRIGEIEEILGNAELASEAADEGTAYIGSAVTVLDMEYKEEETMYIVGSNEANSRLNKISNESPIGKALIGAKEGDVVTVDAPAGAFRYKVLKIQRA
ncbi:MAG: transcription elongation factor GreA [Lachnospiraceae bacterium]|nr:transcription elongation factor GreA [Lachnospiraceae bacterium]